MLVSPWPRLKFVAVCLLYKRLWWLHFALRVSLPAEVEKTPLSLLSIERLNQSVEGQMSPNRFAHPTFGEEFSQSLERVKLPNRLLNWTFEDATLASYFTSGTLSLWVIIQHTETTYPNIP